MLVVENGSGFVPGLFVFPDEDGVDTAYFVLKATFESQPGGLRVAEKQAPLVVADEYWGEPGLSSLKRAGEAHLCKPSTDIALIGSAYAPRRGSTPVFDVSLTVGSVSKRLRVFGDRVWTKAGAGRGLIPSQPHPVEKVALVYEKAFGGEHKVDGSATLIEPRNPLGVGFTGKRTESELEGMSLPNIEDASDLLVRPGQAPRPAGLGFVPAHWQPRAGYAGTYDAAWKKKRAPYLPRDFNPRHFQAAHDALVAPSYLKGGEPVELINLSPAGVERFSLPLVELAVGARLAGTEMPVKMNLETVLFEPDESRVTMLWRGSLRCDKQVLRLERASFEVGRVEGVLS